MLKDFVEDLGNLWNGGRGRRGDELNHSRDLEALNNFQDVLGAVSRE